MQTLSAILVGLSWLAVAGMLISAGIAVYALVRARGANDDQEEQEEQKEG